MLSNVAYQHIEMLDKFHRESQQFISVKIPKVSYDFHVCLSLKKSGEGSVRSSLIYDFLSPFSQSVFTAGIRSNSRMMATVEMPTDFNARSAPSINPYAQFQCCCMNLKTKVRLKSWEHVYSGILGACPIGRDPQLFDVHMSGGYFAHHIRHSFGLLHYHRHSYLRVLDEDTLWETRESMRPRLFGLRGLLFLDGNPQWLFSGTSNRFLLRMHSVHSDGNAVRASGSGNVHGWYK